MNVYKICMKNAKMSEKCPKNRCFLFKKSVFNVLIKNNLNKMCSIY